MACVFAWLSSTALGIATKYVEQGVTATINQFRYMCCLKEFEAKLNEEEHSLSLVQQEVDRIIKTEAKNTKVPDECVDDWIKRTNATINDVHLLQTTIKEDKRCLNSWCPDLFWRWSRSKEADDLTATLKNLKHERTEFQKLTHEADMPNLEFIQSKDYMLFKAPELALRDIMTALETDGVNMIGLHGMPGVGKTTLAIKVKEEAERRKLFSEFVKVTVTEKPNINALQDRVAEQLQLKFNRDASMEERASKLMLRLKDEKKKFLVLDDVWQELNLKDIGIPYGGDLKTCKILLTTRRIPVCESMNCQKKILLDIFTAEEAWALFKVTACVDDDDCVMIDVAKMVAKECGRLPVAIVSVAKALKGKPLHGWERALKKLQEGGYQEIRDMSKEENAYKSLKFSFDEVPREETKRCLLLCSLFPEDHEISIEDLTRYAVGLRLYHSTRSVKDTMIEVLDAVDELKDSHLLLEAETEGHVKMHDLVRDVVLLIGKGYSNSKTGKEFTVGSNIGLEEWPMDESFKDYAAFSLLDNAIEQLPDQMDYPKLEMLLISRRSGVQEGYVQKDFTSILEKSFEGMQKLEVLSITRGILSMQSLGCLTNLRTLELRYCKFSTGCSATAEDLASLRYLQQLEILSFHGSDINELPDEIGELKNLKVLDLTNCYCLQTIAPNLIRKLSKLEELLIGAFEDWDIEGEGASVAELDSLQHLGILTFAARGHIPETFAFFKLIGYHLHMCDCESPSFYQRLRYPSVRSICIVPTEETVRVCKELFNNVYELRLDSSIACFKNMMPDISETGFKDLSRLSMYGCEFECLVNTTKQHNAVKRAFSNLVELEIVFSNLREICDGQPSDGFLEKLQILKIEECEEMITALPSKLLQGMGKLQKVTIVDCENLQDVFQVDGLDETNKDCLWQLKSLELDRLNALTCIWKDPSHYLNLKSLIHLMVSDCESLPSLFSVSFAQGLVQLEYLEVSGCDELEYIISEKDQTAISEAHPPKLLQNLKILKVEKCHKLHYIFPITMLGCLLQLTELHVKACNQLVAMFGKEDQPHINTMEEMVFPKLMNLYLEELPKFGAFCVRGYDFIFPSLQLLKVKTCPEMTTSFSATLDGFVYTDPIIEPPLMQDTKIGSSMAQMLVPPKSINNDLEWLLSEGKWILQKRT